MLKGIDVSHHNGTPDFAKAKAAGVAFVYVKATEGKSYRDPMFQPNMYNAMRAGLPVGCYHFARPFNSPEEDAANFVEAISIFKYNLLPVLDLEDAPAGMSDVELYRWARAFVNAVKSKTGHQVMVYTGLWFLNKYPALKKLNDLPLWIAAYRSTAPVVVGWSWTMWQFTQWGDISGVGQCDVSYIHDLQAITIGGGATVAQAHSNQAQSNNQILLKLGDKGDLVKKLQERLQINADGIFGPLTEESVKEWQRLHGLVADGIVGPKTWAALFPPAPPPPPMYRVIVDGKVVVDTAYADKVAAAVQDAVTKHAKEIVVKPR